MESRIYDLETTEWAPLRPDLARGVLVRSLLSADQGGLRMALARVLPGGEFTPHRDPYHHLFWFLQGEGEGVLGEERYAILPGRVVEVPAGTLHGYRNTGAGDLLLLTTNLPAAAAE